MSSQHHAPAPLHPVPTEQKGIGTPEHVWKLWIREQRILYARIRTAIRPVRSLDTFPTILFISDIAGYYLYIYIPTNCTQLIFFVNNILKYLYCLKL